MFNNRSLRRFLQGGLVIYIQGDQNVKTQENNGDDHAVYS